MYEWDVRASNEYMGEVWVCVRVRCVCVSDVCAHACA